ncbi:uncharacterized protein LOC122341848 [Puntigrus tetrazona]|uniref:uncharacterized protein LOC122341848 n=1 Tax=Puntigrus tetrazona TaxID=1606681 RepID=UPI001C8AD2A6|nr:uncharacterized protein LOC122341848 [Puntigrus tetrazona]
MHHFSDASTCGYGQCSYLRMINENDEIHCTFLIGKARVSPSKIITIPRLELTAAVVSVRMSNMLREELNLTNVDEFFWTDSKVVLGYINNDARRFHTFVANRVQKIRQSTEPEQWLYVPTDENPADIASRGRTINELLSSNWFSGPSFLWEREITTSDVVLDLPVGDPEVKKIQTLQTKTTESKDLVDHLSKFSSWSKATKAIARLLRWIKRDKASSPASVSEQEDARCWHAPKRNFQIGDIVMDIDETLPRSEWRLGRITETVLSSDGLVRKAKIALGDKRLNKKGERVHKTSIVERPAQKLVLLLEAE